MSNPKDPSGAPEGAGPGAGREPGPGRRVHQVVAFYPPALGGVEIVVEELSRALAERGREVEVLTSDLPRQGARERARAGGPRVRRHRAILVAHTPVMPGLLVSLLRAPRDTVLHVHVAHALVGELVRWAAAVRRMRYVVHFHLDIGPSGPAGVLLPYYKRWFLAPMLRRAAAVIALSAAMRTELVDDFGLSPERVHVVGNAVADTYREEGKPREAVTSERPLRLLFAGRLAVQKNLPRLLRALHQVEGPLELRVAGDGEDRGRLEQLAAALPHPVAFLGRLDQPALRQEMKLADVFVMTSDREGMPLVAMEAMAMGLPVLSTDVPGARELVTGAGLLVPPTDEGVADGLRRLADSPDLRTELSRAGWERMRDRTWPRVAEEVERVYTVAGLWS